MSQFVLAIVYSLFAYGPTVICDVMTNTNEPSNKYSGGSSSKDRNAFFALRSCHQVLRGDSGEFFSPDYLCSNPPLWCNWTIQVPPGKRVHLQLEDFTPAGACHLKKDQIHLDESADGGLGPVFGPAGDHRILEKCWRKVEFTSLSSTVHVVLLISRTSDPPLRGFYGRFRSLGEHPGGTEESLKNGAEDAENTSDSGVHETQEQSGVHGNHSEIELLRLPNPRSGSSPPSVEPSRTPHVEGEGFEKGTVTWRTVRGHVEEVAPDAGGRGRAGGGEEEEEEDEEKGEVEVSLRRSLTPKKTDRPHADSPDTVTQPPLAVTPQLVQPTAVMATATTQGEVDTNIPKPKVQAAKKIEAVVDYKGRTLSHQTQRNNTHHSHLPGVFLFEVSVEVALSQQAGESWDQRVTTLLTTLKSMMKDELSSYAPKTISSKRIKRLSSGALFLLWLHFGERQDGVQSHRVLHAAAQGLRGRSLLPQDGGRDGVIAYVSITDVNECGTQLSQCDAHAECVNRFGTYTCRCRPGYLDKSRGSPGGTICIDPDASGCSWSTPPVLRGIYCVCFLLCLLVVLLLCALGVMYRRRHQGAFLLRCQSHSNGSGLATVAGGSSGGGGDNNNNNRNDQNGGNGNGGGGGCLKMSAVRNRPLPSVPPPPPTRRPKEGADGGGSLEPPLLKFGPLPHADGSECRAK